MSHSNKKKAHFPNVAVLFIPDKEQGGYTAYVPDIPAYGEGKTKNEAIADLKMGIQVYVDEFGLEETLSRISGVSAIQQMNFGDFLPQPLKV